MTKTVLCADDSVTMQTVAEITFRASDYKYVGARSAEEALKLAKQDRPAIILADAVMPGKSGYDLCAMAKADPELAEIPVVLLCGNSQAYDAAKGTDVGADGHLTKPWDSQVMLDKIGEFIGKAASQGVATASAASAKAAPAPAPTPAPKPAPVAAKPVPVAKPAAPRPPRAATPPPVKPMVKPAPKPAPAVAAAPAMRPPMIKGTPTKRPASLSGVPTAAPASASGPRSATLMGMPSLKMPPGKGNIPGVTSVSSHVSASVVEVVERAELEVPAAAQAAASAAGLDPNGPEVQALMKLSREVIERIAWEIVPDLADTIIREKLNQQ